MDQVQQVWIEAQVSSQEDRDQEAMRGQADEWPRLQSVDGYGDCRSLSITEDHRSLVSPQAEDDQHTVGFQPQHFDKDLPLRRVVSDGGPCAVVCGSTRMPRPVDEWNAEWCPS